MMQIGLGAILMTADTTLTRDVDKSGTYQWPWVRNFGELKTLPAPTESPFTPAEAPLREPRRTKSPLRALDARVRDSHARGQPASESR